MTFLGWPQGPRNPPRHGPNSRCRPLLEPLEDRWVPAQFFHLTGITVPGSGTTGQAAPYPANIVVSGMAGTVSKVTVKLEFIYHDRPDDLDVLLVAPNGANAILLSDVGGDHPVAILPLTLDDAAAAELPDNDQLNAGTFRPTNVGAGDTFPAPAPTPSGGSALSVFNGINPNGTWSLYVVDDASGVSGTIAGGWTLVLEGVGIPTTTAVSAAPNPALFGQAVTLSATVTGSGSALGTVTFRDGDTVLGTAPLNHGRAALTVPGLGPGTHAITAVYSGGSNFILGSTSEALSLVVNDQITAAPFRRNGVAKVRVRAATTGAVRAVLTPFKRFRGRLTVQLQDVNGDSVLDLIVKAVINGKHKKKVFDAVTLALLG